MLVFFGDVGESLCELLLGLDDSLVVGVVGGREGRAVETLRLCEDVFATFVFEVGVGEFPRFFRVIGGQL